MYGWIWRHLPGPRPVKALLAVVLLVLVVLVLFQWVFPWLEPRLPFNDVTVDDGGQGASALLPAVPDVPRLL